jgi:aminoglycoside phosphotransferase (APT) family kinase protein
MTVPSELRRTPPRQTLEWAARQVGRHAKVVRVRRLRNAWAAAVHAIDVLDGHQRHTLVLRRWARTDLPPDEGVVENEVAVLTALAATSLSAPRLVAVDADARVTDVPAVLMTRLVGRVELAPTDTRLFVRALAATLHDIHDVDISPPMSYDPWLELTEPPPWTRMPDIWKRTIEIAYSPVPRRDGLCHRDYHPGNVLWSRGRVTGVVDWTHACRGPQAADVAHCRINLALLLGLEVANDFSDCYGAVDDLAHFDLEHAVSAHRLLDDLWRFHDAGRTDLTAELAVDRLDAFVADAVKRCG